MQIPTTSAKAIADLIREPIELALDWDHVLDGLTVIKRDIGVQAGPYTVNFDAIGTFVVLEDRGDWWNEPQFELKQHTMLENIRVYGADDNLIEVDDHNSLAVGIIKRIYWT